MDKSKKRTIMTVAFISAILCGLPGCFLLISGLSGFYDIFGAGVSLGSFTDALVEVLINSGFWICLGGALILVPLLLIIIAILQRRTPKPEEAPEKSAFEDEPLPPTS